MKDIAAGPRPMKAAHWTGLLEPLRNDASIAFLFGTLNLARNWFDKMPKH